MVKVEDPLASVWVIGEPPSTLSDTSPLGGPAAELMVSVTVPLALYVTVGAWMATLVAAWSTCKVASAVLAAKLPCAAKLACRLWLPADGLFNVKTDWPLASSGCVTAEPP